MKREIYKVLEFKEVKKGHFKYAHPLRIFDGKNDGLEWGSSAMPLLMTYKTTLRDLKQIYKVLDFDGIKIVPKVLIDIETNNT